MELKKHQAHWSQGRVLLQDAKTLCNSFAQWSINHVNRTTNNATHNLAKNVIYLEEDLSELKVISKCISHTIIMD